MTPRAARTCPGYTLSPATRIEAMTRDAAQGCADLPWATRCRPLRGFRRCVAMPPPRAARTCPGLHAGARYAGSGDASRCRRPGLRGLALGYTLLPATRVAVSRCGNYAVVEIMASQNPTLTHDRIASSQKPRVLDIGCGANKVAGAIGMDVNPRTAADVIHDLDDLPYPFADDEFDEVIGRHVIE